MQSIVYFTKEITPEGVVKLYDALKINLPGKVAIKVHSGEKGNQNFIKPDFWQKMVSKVNGTVVECNTAYKGSRHLTYRHEETMKLHGWSDVFNVDIMDSTGDLVLDIPNGKVIKKNYVGKNMANYDSMLVLSHFKGHPMGGFGGALKQLSIGCASTAGKCYIHSAGRTTDMAEVWKEKNSQELFLDSMADSASGVVKYFEGKIAFINVMKNLSVDCDCCSVAEDPCMKDIGILASVDPIALDQACVDLIYKQTSDPGQKHFIERIETRNGLRTIESADKLGFGTKNYELREIR